jgi:hypothetical protein
MQPARSGRCATDARWLQNRVRQGRLAALKEINPLEEMFRRAAEESGHPVFFAVATSIGFAALLVIALKLLLQN